jgi:4a-hydroxytetrahydrobiopterin dehydratase
MKKLENMECVPCRGGEPVLTNDQIAELLPQIPEWKLIEIDSVQRLERQFKFESFSGALAFTNQVGSLAEAVNHHPAILTEWGKVTVTWWTHILDGLHINDFILAARTDGLYESGN